MTIYPSNPFSVTVQEVALITEDTLLQVYPKSVWLRKVIVGTPRQETITLTNPSAASIALTSYVNSNSEYDITGLSQSEVIEPGATKTFTIDYDPFAGGGVVQTGSLTLNCNNGQTHVINIWSSKFDSAVTVIPVTGPRTLDDANANYVLQNDINATGRAFIVAADHVSLDLNGYTITYGSDGTDYRHAIFHSPSWYVYGGSMSTADGDGSGGGLGFYVGNGNVKEYGYDTSSSAGSRCHGMFFGPGMDQTEVDSVNFYVNGDGVMCLVSNQSSLSHWVHGCTFRCTSTNDSSYNRHQLEGHVVKLGGTAASVPAARVNNNFVYESIQGGFQVGSNEMQYYQNYVEHDSILTNGFAFWAGRDSDIFNNTVDLTNGSGRGLRAGEGQHYYNNTVVVTTKANPEYGAGYYSYGIQFEDEPGYSASNMRCYNNNITGLVIEGQNGTDVLRFTNNVAESVNNKIFRNVFRARRVGNPSITYPAKVFSISSNAVGTGFEIVNNDFYTDEILFYCGWTAGTDWILDSNRFYVDDNPAANIYCMLDESGGGTPDFDDTVFLDNEITGISYNTAAPYSYLAPYISSWSNQWTLTVVVTSNGTTPISGATVDIGDAATALVSSQTTPANGTVTAELIENVYNWTGIGSPTTDAKTPHDLTISAGGYSNVNHQVTMNGIKTITVNMTTGAVT